MKTEKGKTGAHVDFQLVADPGSEVYVAGSFNNWNPRAHPLQEDCRKGFYRTAVQLPRGRHEYKFLVNGQWRVDPACLAWASNTHGTVNCVLCA